MDENQRARTSAMNDVVQQGNTRSADMAIPTGQGECSDDEVIFVEERRVETVPPVSVKSEPTAAEEGNGKEDMAERSGVENQAQEREGRNVDMGTGSPGGSQCQEEQVHGQQGRQSEGTHAATATVTEHTAHIKHGLPVAEQHTDNLSIAVQEVLRSLENEGTAGNGEVIRTAVLQQRETTANFRNVFTPHFIGPMKYVDTSKLSGKHMWDTNEMRNIPFHHWVTNNPVRRTDMQFFQELYEYHPTVAKNSWAQLREHVRYVIPETLICSRSFVREMLEIYYLDRMDAFLETVRLEDISVQNIPLLQERITDRQWNVFSKRPGYFQELYNRKEHKLWLPHDQPEIETYSIDDLRGDYPEVEQWFQELDQPSGIPIPCPPIVYYYHHELVSHRGSSNCSIRLQKLQAILRLEFACLFLCTWFMECALGGRHFLLRKNTVEAIAQCMRGRQSIIRDVSTAHILDLMRQGGMYDSQLYNTFQYVKTKDEYYNMYREHEPPLPDCYFLACYKGSGIIMTRSSGGQVAYQTLWCRRMNMALKQSKKSEREWRSPLDAILSAEDLDRLPELRALIRARNWDQNSELCVYDLLRNLLNINSRSVQTNIRISSGSTSLRRERDSLVRIINNAIDGPPQQAEEHVPSSDGRGDMESVQNDGTVQYAGASNRRSWSYRDHGKYNNYYGNVRSGHPYGTGAADRDMWESTVWGRSGDAGEYHQGRYSGYGSYAARAPATRELDYDGTPYSARKRPRLAGNDGNRNVPSEQRRVETDRRQHLEPGRSLAEEEEIREAQTERVGSASGGTLNKITANTKQPCASESRPSSGKDLPSAGPVTEVPSGGLMPAFQATKSARQRTVCGEGSTVGGTIEGRGINTPGTPGTPIHEVDISGNVGDGINPGNATSPAPPGVGMHPWGFTLK